MTIHAAIKALRTAKGWSHTTLGAKVAEAEGLAKPLAWQTVQQWERDDGTGTAPKRKRLDYVAQVLDTTTDRLLAGNPEPLGSVSAPDQARQRLLERLRTADPATVRLVELALMEDDPAAIDQLSPSLVAMVRGLKNAIRMDLPST